MPLPVVVTGLVAGALIGSIGIGGVLIVPALVYLLGVPVHMAVAAALAGLLASGLVGTWVHGRGSSIHWPSVLWLSAGALPAACLGAWAASLAPALVLEMAIGVLAGVAGVRALAVRATVGGQGARQQPARPALMAAGGVTGLLSALTGTSGPLVLVPILIELNMPVLAAVGLSQAIQLPIAAVATAGNAALGAIDWVLAAWLALGLGVGTAFGARLAHRLPALLLRRIVAVMLTLVGAAVLVRILLLR